MVNQARVWRSSRAVELANVYFEPWHCAIAMIHIDGYRCVALETPWELLEDGAAMFHCVYALRRFSEAQRPSRFFSLRRGALRIATAEIRPHPDGPGWYVRDVRLSFNRLPSEPVVAIARVLADAYSFICQWRVGRACGRPGAMSCFRVCESSASDRDDTWVAPFLNGAGARFRSSDAAHRYEPTDSSCSRAPLVLRRALRRRWPVRSGGGL